MEEKKELNLSDAQLEEIAGGLNKQQIKDAAGKVIKFGKNNVKEILLAATAVTSAAALAVSLSTKYDNDKLKKGPANNDPHTKQQSGQLINLDDIFEN